MQLPDGLLPFAPYKICWVTHHMHDSPTLQTPKLHCNKTDVLIMNVSVLIINPHPLLRLHVFKLHFKTPYCCASFCANLAGIFSRWLMYKL